MSTFKVEVVPFTLEKHPNADTLSIAHIRGWTCVVKTSDFESEKLGVYVPLDAVADENHPLLGFMQGKRVKTKKLRGVISQGILLPLTQVAGEFYLAKGASEGDDLAEIVGVKKWEEPIKPAKMNVSGGDEEISRPAWLHKYTDIENIKNYPNVIQEGEEVEITEKLHGTSAIYALIDGKFYIGSRNRILRTEVKYKKAPVANKLLRRILSALRLDGIFYRTITLPVPNSVWHQVANEFCMEFKLGQIAARTKSSCVAVHGEIVGVQDLMYGLEKGQVEFYAYDVRLSGVSHDDYVDPATMQEICAASNIPTCPVLKVGPFSRADLDLRLGKTTLAGGPHVREGVIIKPLVPRSEHMGRVILKSISEDYLMRNNATDY